MNIYICEHGCHNITVDVDKGVTPFMIPCEFRGRPDRPANPKKMKNGKCIGIARSCMYPQELGEGIPYPKPEFEWYRPDLKEFNALSNPEKDHVKQGGLLMRKITNKDPILHEDKWSYEDEDFKKELEKYNESQ